MSLVSCSRILSFKLFFEVVSDFSFQPFKFLCGLAAINAFFVVFLFDASSARTEFNGFLRRQLLTLLLGLV